MIGTIPGARHRFTADQVLRMVDGGILDESEHLELLYGELIEMSPQGPAHSGLTVRLRDRLIRLFGAGHHVRDHSPLIIGDHSLPEPDLAVIRGDEPDLERLPTPADAVLVVEISVTSQRADRAKADLYGAGGVPEYWNLDVSRRRLIVYRQPSSELGGYSLTTVLGHDDSVAVAGSELRVRDLLPPATPG